ncbi:MAG: 2-amino-4-hydroxy-6-hydroxymethyldihydropteridine diphosphokinase [Anaerolineales bacterium]|jgi:2-amino-4-hydroxy-6-hydroxymethyldihydropteridine diphosphokinase
MDDLNEAYLNIGSNIEPEFHLREAVRLLRERGEVKAISNAWQSHAFGSDGPDFLNACVLFMTPLDDHELKEQVIRPIEAELGRVRGPDKFAPRTIDIDIILFDDEPFGGEFWSNAFVVVPLADILPDFHHPLNYERLSRVAEHMRRQTWIEKCPDVLNST